MKVLVPMDAVIVRPSSSRLVSVGSMPNATFCSGAKEKTADPKLPQPFVPAAGSATHQFQAQCT